MSGPRNPGEWLLIAHRNLNDARVLLTHGGSAEAAYFLAGAAAECALKAMVMRDQGLDEWPVRGRAPELYRHDLGALLKHGGLHHRMEREQLGGTAVADSWLMVKTWTQSPRYAPGPMPKAVAHAMVRAVGHPEEGVVPWIESLLTGQ